MARLSYKANVPLAGGMVAAYNSSGLLNYHHVDWLGSYRLASTPSRAVYWDGAYAPFGEPYAQGGSSVDLSFTGQNALIGPEPGGPKERWKRNAEVAEPMANIDGIERELRMLRDNAKQFETEGTGGWRTLNAPRRF